MTNENKTILIVEDEKSLIDTLNKKFHLEGFKVLLAMDGEQGLERALSEHPDLILLDIIMPKMDGMTMLKELRKDQWGKDVPVIILTNLTNAEDVTKAMESGVYNFLVKSDWTLGDLVTQVRNKLNA